MNIRINKLLSDSGLGSRREVEELITDCRVTINGELAKLSDVVEETDIVLLDGEELPVEDIIREYAAEQKMRIAEQVAAMRFADDDFLTDDDNFARPSMRKQRTSKGSDYTGGKRNAKGGGRPAKFKKFDDEDDFSSQNRRYNKSSSSKKGFTKPMRKVAEHHNGFMSSEFEPTDFSVKSSGYSSRSSSSSVSSRSREGERSNNTPRPQRPDRNRDGMKNNSRNNSSRPKNANFKSKRPDQRRNNDSRRRADKYSEFND